MSSDSTNEGEVPHYGEPVLGIIPPFLIEIEVPCHHAETNDICLLGGRVGPIPITKINKVEIFLLETLVLHIGFRLPSDTFSTMHLYWEQTVIENYYGIKYSLYVANVAFRDVINSFRNVGGAQAFCS